MIINYNLSNCQKSVFVMLHPIFYSLIGDRRLRLTAAIPTYTHTILQSTAKCRCVATLCSKVFCRLIVATNLLLYPSSGVGVGVVWSLPPNGPSVPGAFGWHQAVFVRHLLCLPHQPQPFAVHALHRCYRTRFPLQ